MKPYPYYHCPVCDKSVFQTYADHIDHILMEKELVCGEGHWGYEYVHGYSRDWAYGIVAREQGYSYKQTKFEVFKYKVIIFSARMIWRIQQCVKKLRS